MRAGPALLLALVLALSVAACAPRQDNRSSAEIACTNEAERLMLERNRGQAMRQDVMGTGARTVIEETNLPADIARDAAFAERQRLVRDCLRRVDEAARQRQGAFGGAPAAAPLPAPPPAPPPRR